MIGLKQINRINKMGLRYSILRQDNQVLVVHGNKSVVMDIDLDSFNQAWYNWYVGDMKIQEAFPTLSAAHREFLMTGITETEWNEIFKEDEDDNESD